MELLTTTHGYLRLVILVLGLTAITLSFSAAAKRKPLSAPASVAYRTYVWTLSLQLVIGLVLLVARWSDFDDGLRFRLEHAFIMVVTVGIAHWGLRFAKRSDALGTRNTFMICLGTLILIILGILILPNGSQLLGLAR